MFLLISLCSCPCPSHTTIIRYDTVVRAWFVEGVQDAKTTTGSIGARICGMRVYQVFTMFTVCSRRRDHASLPRASFFPPLSLTAHLPLLYLVFLIASFPASVASQCVFPSASFPASPAAFHLPSASFSASVAYIPLPLPYRLLPTVLPPLVRLYQPLPPTSHCLYCLLLPTANSQLPLLPTSSSAYSILPSAHRLLRPFLRTLFSLLPIASTAHGCLYFPLPGSKRQGHLVA